MEANGFYQVLDGLREGDRIVTSSQFLIDSESNLKAAVGAMVSGSAADEDMVDDPAAADEGMVDDPSAAVGHEDHVH